MPTWKLMGIALIVLVILDGLWLGFIANRFYISELGDLARLQDGKLQPVLWAAAIVYVMLVLGTVFLALPHAQAGDPWWVGMAWGALLGLVVYGTYDMTNMATLARWPLTMTFVDMAWGTVLCGVTVAVLKVARDSGA